MQKRQMESGTMWTWKELSPGQCSAGLKYGRKKQKNHLKGLNGVKRWALKKTDGTSTGWYPSHK